MGNLTVVPRYHVRGAVEGSGQATVLRATQNYKDQLATKYSKKKTNAELRLPQAMQH